jgi:hypothetical protein
MITCKLCNKQMEEHEGNNPQPLLPNFEDRVCRSCNNFVTATRMYLLGYSPVSQELLAKLIGGIIQTAYSLGRTHEEWKKKMEEEE